MEPQSRRQKIGQLKDKLWTDRSSFDAHWRELSDFIQPRRTRFQTSDRNRGEKRNSNIIDSTATMAARTLQSGLHAGLTSPARPWFKLTVPDPDLAESAQVKAWLHQTTKRMQVVFGSSNLYNSLPIVYGDMGTFGTAAMAVVSDRDELMRCYVYPIGSYGLGLDHRGRVTTFIREYELSVRQVVEQFGVRKGYRDIDWTNLSAKVKRAWDASQYEDPVTVVWAVVPNEDARPDRLEAKYLPWSSLHWEKDNDDGERDKFLLESGFKDFPIMAPRWDITGEDTYGTSCPGMIALGDVKGLQQLQKEKAKAVAKQVNPPLVGEPYLRTQKTSLLPGDITYTANPQHGLKPVHEVQIRIDHLVGDIQETQYRIKRCFFEDLFLMLATAPRTFDSSAAITAREVDERHEEKLLALGPVLERTNDELLNPLIDRVFNMMLDAGMVPDPPQELEGVKLRVEYVSIMAQAQKLVGVVAQDRFVASVAPLLQVASAINHKINWYQLVDNYNEMLGNDPRVVRSNDEAQQIADAEAQQAQAQLDAQQAMAMAKAAKDASQTPMGTDSALDRVLAGTTAGGAPGITPGNVP